VRTIRDWQFGSCFLIRGRKLARACPGACANRVSRVERWDGVNQGRRSQRKKARGWAAEGEEKAGGRQIRTELVGVARLETR
jgi:hypothetical protein